MRLPLVKSSSVIPKSVDRAMGNNTTPNKKVDPGISIRMGPMKESPNAQNGVVNGKRKARSSLTNGRSYKDASSSDDDDMPLVCILLHVTL